MRLNGSRVPYRFPTSNIAVKNAKANMATKADTDIFAEVFYVKIGPGAGFTARGVVFKPPEAHLSSHFSLNSIAGRNRSVKGGWQSSIKNIFNPIRQRYSSGTIDASFDNKIDPVLIVTSKGLWNAGGEANIKGRLVTLINFETTGGLDIVSSPILYDLAQMDATGKQTFDGIRQRASSGRYTGKAETMIDYLRSRYSSLSSDTTFSQTTISHAQVRDWMSIDADGQLNPLSSPICFARLNLDSLANMSNKGIRQRVYAPSFDPTGKQNITPFVIRRTSSQMDTTADYIVSSKITKLYQANFDTIAQQVTDSRVLAYAVSQMESIAEMPTVGSVIFAPHISIDAKTGWGIKSQILQLISQLEYNGDLTPGDLLTIDVENKTVKLNGKNVRHNFEGDFIKLRKGLNKVEYWDEESDRNLEITIKYEPRWL